MRNNADVTGGKTIAVLLQSISGVSAINPLVAFYDIHGGKREVLFFYFVPDTTRDEHEWFVGITIILIASVTEPKEGPETKPETKPEDSSKRCICARCLQAVNDTNKIEIGGQSFHTQCAKCCEFTIILYP
jgi:hypothetical protein